MPLMRNPSSRCWPHEVTLTRNIWGQDADVGRIITGTTTVRQVDCLIQPDDPQRLVSIDPETGLRRITEVIPGTIIFPENPRLAVDDLITWTDEDEQQTHTYQVKSSRSASELGSVWAVRVEEKI